MTQPDRIFFAVIAPTLRRPFRRYDLPGLGTRPLIRWQVVRETLRNVDGIVRAWGYEHRSFHWTRRRALRAAVAYRRSHDAT